MSAGSEPACCWPRTQPGGSRSSIFSEPPPTPVVVAINARIADGKDPSWLWDVDFEQLRGRFVVATGERGRGNLAVRLRYAEVEHTYMPDLIASIGAAGRGDVDVVANYTSFQQIRASLR